MKTIDTGLIYRNPKPHVYSRHAYFPSLVNLGGGELLCSFIIGQAFESADCRIFLARSRDHGATWTLQGRMLPETAVDPFSESCRIMRARDGSLVANVWRFDRRRTDVGLANPETLGFVETDISLYRSPDRGRTWHGPEPVAPPLLGPAFELCSPITELHDGAWLMPTSTWKAWNGDNPTGMKAVAFISHNRGKTWPQYTDVMDGARQGIIYWEHKIIPLQSSRLLAVAWAYHEAACSDSPNAYALSTDGGKNFGPPQETDLNGQTAAIHRLNHNRILCVYRRIDQPGLWAAQVLINDAVWKTERQTALWGTPSLLTGECDQNRVRQFNVLRFGAPCIVDLDDGQILIAFWCVEDCVSNIRWFRLRTDT